MPPARSLAAVLGAGQIFTWGSSYYLPAVTTAAIRAETGWSETLTTGSFSLGLLTAGLVAPWVGRAITRRGGRAVLTAGALLMAAGHLGLALAPHPLVYLLGWVLLGLGMAASLYDAAFAVAGQLYGAEARPRISDITLAGGFASTAFWPLSALLVESIGWRWTSAGYAAACLFLLLPLYHWLLPAQPDPAPMPVESKSKPTPSPTTGNPTGRRPTGFPALSRRQTLAFVALATSLTLGALISAVISVHLLGLYRHHGLSLPEAIALGTLFGPAQVGARILERLSARWLSPLWTLSIASLCMLGGLIGLGADAAFLTVATLLYGAGSGLKSVARGSVPLVLFGPGPYAVLLGWLAMPMLVIQAASPVLATLLIAHAGPTALLAGLIAAAAIAAGAALLLHRLAQASPSQ